MAQRKKPADIRLPMPPDLSLSSDSPIPPLEQSVQRHMVQLAVKASYSISDFAADHDRSHPQQLVSDNNIHMVTALMQSFQPTNAVEAALAAQFTVTHIRGLKLLQAGNIREAMLLLSFSQTTLDSIHRYRNKGMQQINVQYNVNHGQVLNIKNEKVSNKHN